jgi:hypothetical protein
MNVHSRACISSDVRVTAHASVRKRACLIACMDADVQNTTRAYSRTHVARHVHHEAAIAAAGGWRARPSVWGHAATRGRSPRCASKSKSV